MTIEEFLQRIVGGQKNMVPELGRALTRAARLVQRTSQEKYLSGGGSDILKTQTGRLKRSIAIRVSTSSTGAEAQVGTNVVYGRIHELGFRGREQGRQHTRQHHMVRAHSRMMVIPPRPFLSRAIRDKKAEVAEIVKQGMMDMWQRKLRGKF